MTSLSKSTLRILHLEDDANDIELVRFALKKAGLVSDLTVARNREEYVAALEAAAPDVILSDNKVLGFDGALALQLAREKRPGIPFVFVSGAADHDEVREKLMRSGATDCLGKSDLRLLPETIERAVKLKLDRPNMNALIEEVRREMERDTQDRAIKG